jgi:hypothetical protein
LHARDKAEHALFFKDIAIAGALMVIAAGAWPTSGTAAH